MLDSKRQNFHHSKLPKAGAIIRVTSLQTISPKRRAIVESFALNDSADRRYSFGIHLATIRFLDNDERKTLSGIWLEEQ